MLLEKIDKLSNYYRKINQAKKKSFDLSKFQEINSKLQTSSDRFHSIAMVYLNLSIDDKYKIGTLFERKPDFTSVLRIIDQLNEKIENDELVTKPDVDKITYELSEIEKPIREKWEKYLSENSRNAINLIEMIKPLIGDSAKFIILLDSLRSFKNRWPVSENEILSFKKKLLQCEERINELDIKEEIQAFLIKVLSSEATINDLNKNIMDWIKEHNFSSKLIINFNR